MVEKRVAEGQQAKKDNRMKKEIAAIEARCKNEDCFRWTRPTPKPEQHDSIKHDFKVGDRVIPQERAIDNGMPKEYVGQVGIIDEIRKYSSDARIKFSDDKTWFAQWENIKLAPKEQKINHNFALNQRVIHRDKGPGRIKAFSEHNPNEAHVQLDSGNKGNGIDGLWKTDVSWLAEVRCRARACKEDWVKCNECLILQCNRFDPPQHGQKQEPKQPEPPKPKTPNKQDSQNPTYEYTHSAILQDKHGNKIVIPEPDDSWECIEEHGDFWPHKFVTVSMPFIEFLDLNNRLVIKHYTGYWHLKEYKRRITKEKAHLFSYKKFRREVKEPKPEIVETYSGSEVLKSLNLEPKSECKWPKGGRPERKYVK